jgi:hypothetical protein
LREEDLNLRPLGYEPNELPGCSIARQDLYYNLLFGSFVSCFSIWAINQFNQGHRCIVTHAETHFQDARVATWAGVETGAEVVANNFTTLSRLRRRSNAKALVGQRRHLGQSDHGLHYAAQFLGLGDRGFDDFVLDERVHHVAQHREAVLAGAVEFTKSVSVAHGAFLSLLNEQPYQVLPGAHFKN